MQENRSFDHYFGTLAGVRGFADPTPVKFQNGTSVFTQPNGSGTLLPWHLNTQTTSAQCVADLDHSWSGTHSAWNSGVYNGWVAAKTNKTLGFYTRADIPFQYALADAFTVCDANFCSVMGPTNPNRLYLWTGMIDPNGTGGGPVTDNSRRATPGPRTPSGSRPQGVSWKVYQETDNYDDNALAWFKQFQNAAKTSALYLNGMAKSHGLGRRVRRRRHEQHPAAGLVDHRAGCQVASTRLRAPPPAPTTSRSVLSALASNLDVWSTTVFILNYDENDGFFDHVVPPTPPAGTADEFVSGRADRPGHPGPADRRLAVVAGRLGQLAGHFDHTSSIRLIEAWTGVKEPNISAWRRAVCGDLTSALDFTTSKTTYPALPATGPLVTAAASECSTLPAPTPPAQQAMPAQESGTKSARALPYQPNVTGRYDLANGRFWTDFSNSGAQAVALTAYTTAYRTYASWQYLVGANSASRTTGARRPTAAASTRWTCTAPTGSCAPSSATWRPSPTRRSRTWRSRPRSTSPTTAWS